MAGNTVKAIPLSIFDSSAMLVTYQSMNGPAGLPGACFWIQVYNASDEGIFLSYDGITDNEIIPSDNRFSLMTFMGATPNSWTSLLAKGTQIYVRGTAGTGNIYLSGYYV